MSTINQAMAEQISAEQIGATVERVEHHNMLVDKFGFRVGAMVLIDGRDRAKVKAYFPEGSSSFMWPHYKVDFVGGDQNVAVSIKRVGVKVSK